MKNFALICLSTLFFISCVKDKPAITGQAAVELSRSKKVYVINEGGYGYNQASVSLYDPGLGQVIDDFYEVQNKTALGDVAQSLSYINGSYYIVVNNSGKITVCDEQFKMKTTINQMGSPRYILQISNSKAYVSDLSANAISIVDLNANVKTGAIPCVGWTEKMVLIYNKAFVTNMRSNFVYVVNTITDRVTDSIAVGLNSGNLVIDKNDKIWVMSSGDQLNAIPAKLHRINAVTNAVEISFSFKNGDSPGNLCYNKTKDTLYYINNGIFRMPITDQALPQNAFIAANNRVFYGLGVDPENYTLYAADVLDYVQHANIYIYDMKGNQLSFFKAGIISNGFYFE